MDKKLIILDKNTDEIKDILLKLEKIGDVLGEVLIEIYSKPPKSWNYEIIKNLITGTKYRIQPVRKENEWVVEITYKKNELNCYGYNMSFYKNVKVNEIVNREYVSKVMSFLLELKLYK